MSRLGFCNTCFNWTPIELFVFITGKKSAFRVGVGYTKLQRYSLDFITTTWWKRPNCVSLVFSCVMAPCPYLVLPIPVFVISSLVSVCVLITPHLFQFFLVWFPCVYKPSVSSVLCSALFMSCVNVPGVLVVPCLWKVLFSVLSGHLKHFPRVKLNSVISI